LTHHPKHQAQNSTAFQAMIAVTRRVERGDCELTAVCLLKRACVVTGLDWLFSRSHNSKLSLRPSDMNKKYIEECDVDSLRR